MWNFNVPPAIYSHRLDTCTKCKFYKESTQSCGTLILGGSIDELDNDVTFYRKKLRLCGCHMPEKAKYSFFSCPAGKWGKYKLSEKETIELKQFIETLPRTGTIDGTQVKKLHEWLVKMAGPQSKIESCGPCLKKLIEEFQNQLRYYNEEQI